MSEVTPIFRASSNATPVSDIKPPAPDPRAARAHKVHGEILRGVRDGSVYRDRDKKKPHR